VSAHRTQWHTGPLSPHYFNYEHSFHITKYCCIIVAPSNQQPNWMELCLQIT